MKNLYLFLTGTLLMCLGGSAQCITNGNFEAGVTVNYTFSRNPETNNFSISGCNVDTSGYPTFTMSPLTNQFGNEGGTLVEAASGAPYGPFDETLFNLGTFVHRVSPATGGTRAMKLNKSSAGADISTMSVQIASAPQNIMFDYSMVIENSHPTKPVVQPFFAVRMYSVATGDIIPGGGFCLKADVSNPEFVETNTGDVLYTDWQCGSLAVPAAFVGQNIRLEFVITDCGENGHFGTVYLDNIRCGTACNVFGEISLNDVTKSCPGTPFSVCGSYINPTNATIINNTITLTAIDANGVVISIPVSPLISGNTFCFTVNPSIFGANPSGNYEFRVSADFQTATGPVELWGGSSSLGPDVTFSPIDPINSFVVPGLEVLYWDDVDDTYILEFVGDGTCCPGYPDSDTIKYYTVTTNDNFLALDIVLARIGPTRCFRWRVKTACGWSGWCCLAPASFGPDPTAGSFVNLLAPDCYNGVFCEDSITIYNDSQVEDLQELRVDKEISIIAYNKILTGGKAIYHAGNFIELLPLLTPDPVGLLYGFTAEAGSIFTAEIQPCEEDETSFAGSSFEAKMDTDHNENRPSHTNSTVVPENLIVFPNPTKGMITITGKTAKVFTVIDITGKEMMRIENSNNDEQFEINLSGLNPGVYFLTADGTTIQKVVKE